MPPPPPPQVRVEIGEVVISLRAPDRKTPRPALSLARRAPRAHAIPLPGAWED